MPSEMGEYDVVLDKVAIGWKENVPILKDLSLRMEKGKKYCLLGKVGEGKSTFLHFLIK